MTFDIIGFHFQQPAWLWALFLPLLLWWLPRAQLRDDYYDRLKHYADPHLLPYLVMQNTDEKSQKRHLFYIWSLLWIFSMLAMAGPRWNYTDIDIFTPTSSVVILLDLSRSMEAKDVRPTRLAMARHEIEDIVRQGEGMRFGLVAFATVAHVIAPITDDRAALLHLFSALSTDLVRLQGSRLTGALERSRRLLLTQPQEDTKAILLVTDGDFFETGLQHQVRKLQSQGIQLHILGIGTEKGTTVPSLRGGWLRDNKGKQVISRLDSTSLQTLAMAGGGTYVQADYQGEDTHQILDVIQSNKSNQTRADSIRIWHERYHFPIIAMMILVLWRFRFTTISVRRQKPAEKPIDQHASNYG